jgi:hypothetical protein
MASEDFKTNSTSRPRYYLLAIPILLFFMFTVFATTGKEAIVPLEVPADSTKPWNKIVIKQGDGIHIPKKVSFWFM